MAPLLSSADLRTPFPTVRALRRLASHEPPRASLTETKPAWAVSTFSKSTYNVVKHVSGHLHKHMSIRAKEGEELLGSKAAGEFVGSVGVPEFREEDKRHITSARAKVEPRRRGTRGSFEQRRGLP